MKKILSFLIFFVTCFFLSSCGGGMSSEELYLSRAILLEDGSTEYILYNYYGDELGRITVPAPIKGDTGEEGNGILSVSKDKPEGSTTTTVKIDFTDESMESFTFDVDDGVSVVDVTEPFIDEETGREYVLLIFSDGNTSTTPIYLPQGKDGNGIDDFDFAYDEETNRIYLYISFTDESMEDIYYDFAAPEDGRGVAEMSAEVKVDPVDNEEKYFIYVKYTDDTETTLKLPKPADPNKWYTSSDYQYKENIPNVKKGDFFFDIQEKKIWLREATSWREIVNFNTPENKYTVTFDLNLTVAPGARFISGEDRYENISYGTYGIGKGLPLPVVACEGYEFLGWSIHGVESQYTGYFTDFTPVFDNLDLKATWKKIE